MQSCGFQTGLGEFDRVLGGGIVTGSLILVGGDPGIGKSTLLLQICQTMKTDGKILYVSGEESARQLKMRAQRLGVTTDELYIVSQVNTEHIVKNIDELSPSVSDCRLDSNDVFPHRLLPHLAAFHRCASNDDVDAQSKRRRHFDFCRWTCDKRWRYRRAEGA